MGDVRFDRPYERVAKADRPERAIEGLADDEVVMALAAAAREHDPYLSNVLATETMNRLLRATAILRTLAEGVVATDTEGRIRYANPAAARLLGWTPEELVGKDAHATFHFQSEDGAPIPVKDCAQHQALRDGAPRASRDAGDAFTRKDGSVFPVHMTAAPIRREGETVGAVCIFRDVTRELEAERATRRVASLVTHASAAITEETPEGVVTHWNPAAERLFGYTEEEMLGSSIARIVPEDLRHELDVTREVGRGGAARKYETQRVCKDGRRIDVSVILSPLRSESGRVMGLSAIYHDVTEAKRAERAMRESEARFRALFHANPVPTFVVEPGTTRILGVNEAAVLAYGYSEEEFTRLTLADIRPPEDVPAFRAYVAAHPDGPVAKRLWRHRVRDGSILDVEVTSRKAVMDGREAIVAVARDVTAEKRAEAEVERARASERQAYETARYRLTTLLPAVAWGAGATILFRTLLIAWFALTPEDWNDGLILVTTTLALAVGFVVGAAVYAWRRSRLGPGRAVRS